MFVIAAFYRFSTIKDCQELKGKLMELFLRTDIKGTAIVAHEGINGTIAGHRNAIDSFKNFLRDDGRFLGVEYKESFAPYNPFKRLKVKIKPEIVTMGVPTIDAGTMAGTYVDPVQWNELISDPNVVVLDVRNDFEVEMGTFKHAINPKTKTFREFPAFVADNLSPKTHQKIAMTCTGGIRCEKASAYLKQQGFKEVYHLKGGILQYIEDMPKEQSLWHGDCFVFDERIAVDNHLQAIAERVGD